MSPAYAQPDATITVSVALSAPTNKPSLGMAAASNIMAETACLGGSVTATNGFPVSERGIYWGTNSGTVLTDGAQYSHSGAFEAGDFSFFVTNLPAGRTIFFLAYAVNSQGTNFTAESSFLTRPAAPGILPPTNIAAHALYANWLPAESSTNYLLDVAATNDFAEYLAGYSNRVAGAELACAVTGLQTRVVYYYRVRSENATGVSTNSAVMTVSQGAIGLLPASLSYTGVYGGLNPAAQNFVVTNSGYWDFAFTNSTGYSTGAAGWWLAAPATGELAGVSCLAITGGVDITGLNAGTYYVTNAVISAEATNSPWYLVATLTVDKADQAVTNFTPQNGSVFAATNTTGLNATGGGSTNPVMFAVIAGPGVMSGLTNLTFTNSGTVSVTASQSGDTNWNAAPDMTNTYIVLDAAILGQTITNFMSINGSVFEVADKVGLSAQASSLLPVNFAVQSGPGAITDGTNLVFTTTGLVSIVASQAGNTFYDAAPDVTHTFTVASLPPDAPRADITVSDMVYLPVNVTNLTTAGTVSFRLGNLGPDPLNSAEVAFDFRIGFDNASMVLLGSDQRAFTLAAGQEQLVILTAQAKLGLTVPALLSGVKQVQVTVRHARALIDPNLANNTATAAGLVLVRVAGANSPARSLNDYDGDGKADISVYNSDSRFSWYVALSGMRYSSWLDVATGCADLTPVPGDYDGDRITDMAVYHRLSGDWTVLLSSTEQIINGQFGGPDYIELVPWFMPAFIAGAGAMRQAIFGH